MQLSIIAVVVLSCLACTVIATKLVTGQDGGISNRTTRRINVVYPANGYFYMLGSASNKPVVCLALDEYKSGRGSDGTKIGTYTSCNYMDRAFEFELVAMVQTSAGGSGSGDSSPSDCVMIRNRYSGTCLTVPNTYQEGSGIGAEIVGAPVAISGCASNHVNLGKSRYQAWRIVGMNPPWIETCSMSETKYLTRGVTNVQKAANLFVSKWKDYGTQGWTIFEPTETEVSSSMPSQYGCGSAGDCWAGGANSACGAGKWCYTTGGTATKCRKKFDCIAHSQNACSYAKCESF